MRAECRMGGRVYVRGGSGGNLQHESCRKGGRGENGAVNGVMEEVVVGSRDDWAGEGVGVLSNLLKNRFMLFTHV